MPIENDPFYLVGQYLEESKKGGSREKAQEYLEMLRQRITQLKEEGNGRT